MLKLRLLKLCLALSLLSLLLPGAAAAQDKGDELRRAASEGNLAQVKALLDAGADVNSKNSYGGTALAFAGDKGHTEVVKLLLERGANPNVTDTFYNSTPLGWAAGKGHAEIVRALLDKGAEGEDGALMAAVYQDRTEVVKVILERGKLAPEKLSDALATALTQKQTAVADMLKAAGVKEPAPADFAVDAATLKSYEGTYEGADGFSITVALTDGKLTTKSEQVPPLTLGALDAVTFRPAEFAGIKMIFTSENGKVTGMTVDQGGQGPGMALKKKETP